MIFSSFDHSLVAIAVLKSINAIQITVHYKTFIFFIKHLSCIAKKKREKIADLFMNKGRFHKSKSIYVNVRIDEKLNSALF